MTYSIKKEAPVPTKAQDAYSAINQGNYATPTPLSKGYLQAALAKAGYLVHTVADGYNVVRTDWGVSQHCASHSDLQFFATKVGAIK